jgi:flagellar biosynthesis/type III secretory pathway M-ring protein FliF/YscJ
VTAPGPNGGPGGPSDAPGAEQRARAALAAGDTPAAGDVTAVLDELARVRTESEERWQAITRLAPAAKAQRARAESGARSRARLAEHLNALEQLADQAPEPLAQALRSWAAEARALLAAGDSAP